MVYLDYVASAALDYVLLPDVELLARGAPFADLCACRSGGVRGGERENLHGVKEGEAEVEAGRSGRRTTRRLCWVSDGVLMAGTQNTNPLASPPPFAPLQPFDKPAQRHDTVELRLAATVPLVFGGCSFVPQHAGTT